MSEKDLVGLGLSESHRSPVSQGLHSPSSTSNSSNGGGWSVPSENGNPARISVGDAVYSQAAFIGRLIRIFPVRVLRELCPTFLEHLRKPSAGACAASSDACLTRRPEATSIQYLNGLRGIACIFVFNFHFLYAHTQTIVYGYSTTTEHKWLHQLPLLSIPTRGRAMVMVFFVCSGYVLSHRYLQLLRTGNLEAAQRSLSSLAVRRYIRLYAPPAVSMFIVALAAYMGMYDKGRAFNNGTTRGGAWEEHPPRLPSLVAQIKDYLGMLRVWGNPWLFRPYCYSLYDPHTWTIPLELRGSFVLFITLVLRTRLQMLWGFILVAIVTYSAHVYGHWELVSFLGGALIAEIHQITCFNQQVNQQYKENNTSKNGLMLPWYGRCGFRSSALTATWLSNACGLLPWVGFLTGTYLLSFPDNNSQNTVGYQTLTSWTASSYDNSCRPWHVFGAILVVMSTAYSRKLSQIFESTFAVYFGKISYAFYLVHGPIIHGLGLVLVPAVWSILGQNSLALHLLGFAISWIILFPLSVITADIFWRWVDIPIANFTRRVEKFISI